MARKEFSKENSTSKQRIYIAFFNRQLCRLTGQYIFNWFKNWKLKIHFYILIIEGIRLVGFGWLPSSSFLYFYFVSFFYLNLSGVFVQIWSFSRSITIGICVSLVFGYNLWVWCWTLIFEIWILNCSKSGFILKVLDLCKIWPPQFSSNLHVLRPPVSEKTVFTTVSVRLLLLSLSLSSVTAITFERILRLDCALAHFFRAQKQRMSSLTSYFWPTIMVLSIKNGFYKIKQSIFRLNYARYIKNITKWNCSSWKNL